MSQVALSLTFCRHVSRSYAIQHTVCCRDRCREIVLYSVVVPCIRFVYNVYDSYTKVDVAFVGCSRCRSGPAQWSHRSHGKFS